MKMIPSEADNYQNGDKNFDGGKNGGKALGTKLFDEIYGRSSMGPGVKTQVEDSPADKFNGKPTGKIKERAFGHTMEADPNDFVNGGKLPVDKFGNYIKPIDKPGIGKPDVYSGDEPWFNKPGVDSNTKPGWNKQDDMVIKPKPEQQGENSTGKPNLDGNSTSKPQVERNDADADTSDGADKHRVRPDYLDFPPLPELRTKCGENDKCFSAPRDSETGKPTDERSRIKEQLDESRLQRNGEEYTDERGRLIRRTPYGVVILENGFKPLDNAVPSK